MKGSGKAALSKFLETKPPPIIRSYENKPIVEKRHRATEIYATGKFLMLLRASLDQ